MINIMIINRVTIYFLLVCVLLITGTQSIHAEVMYLPTQSITPGTVTRSPTGPPLTPSHSSTPLMTPSMTATTTLIPLPEITLVFPASTPTPTVTITPTLLPYIETPKPVEEKGLNNLSPRVKLLVVLIAILWLILMGFAILYIRQFK